MPFKFYMQSCQAAIQRCIRSRRVRRAVFVVAALAFSAGLWISLQNILVRQDSFNWHLLAVLSLLGIPLGIALNVLGFYLSSYAIGFHPTLIQAVRVTVVSSVANFLPVPAGPVVRTTALNALGATYTQAAKITLALALYWVSIGLSISGVGLALFLDNQIFYGLFALGLASFGGAVIITHFSCTSARYILLFYILAILMHITATINIWLGFRIIGTNVNVLESTIVASSGTAGAFVGIVPGGLGLNEGIAALLSGAVGISASSGFVVVALNRAISYAISLPLALVLLFREKNEDSIYR